MAFAGDAFGRRWCLLVAAAACLHACGDEPTAQGELGNVAFSYVCVGEGDYQCLDGERGMPDFHGVGAHFDVEGDEVFSTRENLETASPNVIENDGEAFTFREEGHGAILIFENFGEIEDFVHLEGIRIEALRIEDENRNRITTLTLMAGTRAEVLVIPEARNGIIPGGSFDYVWVSEDDGVVLPSGGFGRNRLDLVGIAPGSVGVSVSAEGLSARVTVNVTANPDAPASTVDGGFAPFPLADAASDAGTPDSGGDAVATDAGLRLDAGLAPTPAEAGAVTGVDSSVPRVDAGTPGTDAGSSEGGAP